MEPPAPHAKAGSGKTPPERNTVLAPARAGPAARPPGANELEAACALRF